jgi:hypothetical protein
MASSISFSVQDSSKNPVFQPDKDVTRKSENQKSTGTDDSKRATITIILFQL